MSTGKKAEDFDRRKRNISMKPATVSFMNDNSENYIQTNVMPQNLITNSQNQLEGYPKLQNLINLKEKHIAEYTTTPYGCRVDIDQMVPILHRWILKEKLTFDVIMIGALTDNQFIYPLLTQLPIDRLISKPGFLFIWGSAKKINELTKLMNNENWAKRFRKSEELVFIPVDRNSPFHPGISDNEESLFEKMQWHCWMCITGTVRRATDGHLIHCNIDTDLSVESGLTRNSAIPSHLYKVAENFSSATRRLHIIPARTGSETPVRARPGWVIMSPDILLNNFDCKRYRQEICKLGTHQPVKPEIEALRPRSPPSKK
ncbi:LAMI_0F00496g1_1 [Lachancea mirantina]|uniref:LAMI_0F00496g1_1 n=1 Tax=Lachancea mirantina TaxID=1230905 RepID=A0A1G4JVD0_9SACH|nr:LAMI_0F00496g1_1 [Lachancea mirantina]